MNNSDELDNQNQPTNPNIINTPGSSASTRELLRGDSFGNGDGSRMAKSIQAMNAKVTAVLIASVFIALASIVIIIITGVGAKDTRQIKDIKSQVDDVGAALSDKIPGLSAGSPTTWQKVSPAGGAVPHGRLAHAACSVGGKMYIHGGLYGSATTVFDDLWVYDELANSWTELTATGDKPAARLHHTLIDTQNQKTLLLFGGFNNFQNQPGHASFDDLYKLDLATLVWTRLDTSVAGPKPTSRGAHDAVWLGSQSTGYMYVFGGFPAIAATGHLDQMWRYDLRTNTWTDLTPATKNDWDWPDGRIGFAISQIADQKIHLFGGGCSVASSSDDSVAGQCGDDWIFDATTNTFSMLNLTAGSATPGSRRATHGDIAAFGLVFLYGGVYINGTSEVKLYDDLWALQTDPAQGGPRWMQLFPNYNMGVRPPKLFGHTAVRLNDKLVIFGGRVGTPTMAGTNDLWEYHIVKPL